MDSLEKFFESMKEEALEAIALDLVKEGFDINTIKIIKGEEPKFVFMPFARQNEFYTLSTKKKIAQEVKT